MKKFMHTNPDMKVYICNIHLEVQQILFIAQYIQFWEYGDFFIVHCGLWTTPCTETGNKFILVTDNFKILQGFFKILKKIYIFIINIMPMNVVKSWHWRLKICNYNLDIIQSMYKWHEAVWTKLDENWKWLS